MGENKSWGGGVRERLHMYWYSVEDFGLCIREISHHFGHSPPLYMYSFLLYIRCNSKFVQRDGTFK
jgi:hypothetical protein